ncbi:MAG TPA: hypothetical protein VGE58_09200 [Daejeonella sp.]
MNYFLLIFCLIFGSVQTQSHLIPWSESTKIQWKDFKGTPEANPKLYAMTRSGIYTSSLVNGSKLTVVARSVFDKNTSWARQGFDTLRILEHERLHFDITELLARQFKKAVSDKGKFSRVTYKKDLDELNALLSKSYVATQDMYDGETSTFRNSQAEWKKKIAAELVALDGFKGPEVKVLVGN